MRKWFYDLFYYVGIWFFYVLFFTVIFLIPFIIFRGNTEILTNHSGSNFLLAFQIPVLISTIFLCKIIAKKGFFINLNFSARKIIFGFAIGTLLICIFVMLQLILNTTIFSWKGFKIDMAISFTLYMFVALNEELLFRYLLFNHLIKKVKIKYAIVICSLMFGFIHYGNDGFNWLGFINISLFGVLTSLYYVRYNNLSVSIGVHFSWNFFQGPIFGYSVSGYREDSLLYADIANHNLYLNGGDFGAEGSVLLIPITLVFILFVWNNEKLFPPSSAKLLACGLVKEI